MKARHIIFYLDYHKYYEGIGNNTPHFGNRICKQEEVDYEIDDIKNLTIPSKDVNMVNIETVLEEEVEYNGEKYTLANCFASLTKTWVVGKFMSTEDVKERFGEDSEEYFRLKRGGFKGCCILDSGIIRPLKENEVVVDPATLKYQAEDGNQKS